MQKILEFENSHVTRYLKSHEVNIYVRGSTFQCVVRNLTHILIA